MHSGTVPQWVLDELGIREFNVQDLIRLDDGSIRVGVWWGDGIQQELDYITLFPPKKG